MATWDVKMVAKSEPPSLVMCPLKKETSLWKTPFKRSSEQPVIAFYCTDVAEWQNVLIHWKVAVGKSKKDNYVGLW